MNESVEDAHHVLLELCGTEAAEVSFGGRGGGPEHPSVLSLVLAVAGKGHVLLLGLAALLHRPLLALLEVLLVAAAGWFVHLHENVVADSATPYFLCRTATFSLSRVFTLNECP